MGIIKEYNLFSVECNLFFYSVRVSIIVIEQGKVDLFKQGMFYGDMIL